MAVVDDGDRLASDASRHHRASSSVRASRIPCERIGGSYREGSWQASSLASEQGKRDSQDLQGQRRVSVASSAGLSLVRILNHFSATREVVAPPSPADQAGGVIVDRFSAVTILFADIKGFTAWAATQEPERVFATLETLYGLFDALCKKWGIFKVETVGDEYMAVSGLPLPSETHAIQMAFFAADMLEAVETARQLTGHSGLAVRVGMHSGPVVAGVLRGDKPRFQLFGDTVRGFVRVFAGFCGLSQGLALRGPQHAAAGAPTPAAALR